MPYLWGQWPERFAYAFVPLILYCFYQYFISYSKNENKPIFLYLTSLFLGITILVHPLVFFHSVTGITALYIFLSIKMKKFVFNWKHVLIAAIIFFALFMLFPYQTFNIFPHISFKTLASDTAKKNSDLSRLFQWSLNPQDFAGSVPAWYFSFREMHGMWTLPFLLLGILFLILRREERDVFLMAWLVSLYLILHRDMIGETTFLHRSLSASAHIFAPLTAIGAVYASSLVKLPSNLSKYLKYIIVAIFLYFIFSVNVAYASQALNKNTYNPYTRDGFFVTLNQDEYQAGQWILDNVASSYNISLLGIPHTENVLDLTAKKIRWLAAISQHVYRFYYLMDNRNEYIKNNYVLLDYSMLGPLNDKETFNNMQLFEKNNLANHSLVYDKNNIRVYKPEHEKQ